MKDQRVLVVGASGLIGSAVACALAENNEVIGVARFSNRESATGLEKRGLHLIPMDVTRESLGRLPAEVDYIYNEIMMVADVDRLPDQAFDTNSFTVAKLLERYPDCKGLVQGSTGSVYRHSARPVTEEAALSGNEKLNMYVLSKICGDAFAVYYSKSRCIPVAILRYYYPYNTTSGVVPGCVRSVLDHVPVERSSRLINPMFISDVAAFSIKAAEVCASPPAIINVGGEQIVSMTELASMVGEATVRAPEFLETEESTDASEGSWICDSAKRQSLLGLEQISLGEGIRKVIAAMVAAS